MSEHDTTGPLEPRGEQPQEPAPPVQSGWTPQAGWQAPFRVGGPYSIDVLPVQMAFSAGGQTALGYDVFKAQVVPFLSEDDQTIYGTPDAWERMRELVIERLEEFGS